MSVAARTSGETGTTVPRMLLTRKEAAATLGMSLRHFQRHVQPHLRCVYSGQLRLYRPATSSAGPSDEACDARRAA